MEAIHPSKMHEIEERGVKSGVSRLIMMENAGKSVSDFVYNLCEVSGKRKILIIAGTGNNGGDSFTAARHLLYYGLDVSVALIGSEEKIKAEEAKTNWEILKEVGKSDILTIDSVDKLDTLKSRIGESDILIVGIFGTGFKGVPREPQMSVIKAVNEADGKKKISVDIPSGMDAKTGECSHSVVSDYTITMYAPKTGMVANEKSRHACGKIITAEIGVPFQDA